jgi:hypothetical protein
MTLQALELERREDDNDLFGISEGEFSAGVTLVIALAAYAMWRFVRWSTRPPRKPSRVRPAPRSWCTRDPHGRWRSSIRSWWFRDR